MILNVQIQRTKLNELRGKIVGLCITIHHELGPGLLENADENCLTYELLVKTPADIVSPSVPLLAGSKLRGEDRCLCRELHAVGLKSVYICVNLWLKKFRVFIRRLAWIRAD